MKMQRLYKFTFSLLVVTLLSTTFSSCIKESLDDCPSNIRVYFDYLPATYANIKEGINPDEVSQMNLYYFDVKTSLYLGMETDNAVSLSRDYFMTLPKLKTGEYRFVAWGNLTGEYSSEPEPPVVGATTFDQFRTYLNLIEQDSVKYKLTPLFFGETKAEISNSNLTTQEIRIPLVQDTYTINLKVKGAIDSKSKYRYVITDNNAYLDFDNYYIASSPVHYITECGYPVNNVLTNSVTTLKIDSQRNTVLKVIENDNVEPVFKAKLINLIKELEKQHKIEIDFSNMYEFDIEVTIQGSSFIITINGWEVNYSEEVLHG